VEAWSWPIQGGWFARECVLGIFLKATSKEYIFYLPYIALISAFASQMALLGFIFSSLLSFREQVTLWSRIICVQSERERGKKKEEEKAQKSNTSP